MINNNLKRSAIKLSLAAAMMSAATAGQAAQFQTLHSDAWVNFWPGFNQQAEFGTNDDVVFDPALAGHGSNLLPGQPLNPTGSTGSYHFTDGTGFGVPSPGLIMGFFSGTTTTQENVLHVGQTYDVQGVDTFFDQNVFQPYGNGADIDELNNESTPTAINAGPFGIELDPNFAGTMQIAPGNTIFFDYYYRQIDGVGDPVPGSTNRAVSADLYILNGQDPTAIFAGNTPVINAFQFSIAELNGQLGTNGWTMLALSLSSFQFVDENTGLPIPGLETLAGLSSQAYYSVDATIVPIPAALPLMFSSVVGVLALARRRAGQS